MPAQTNVSSRAPLMRVLDLNEAGIRTGYAAQSLRNMMFLDEAKSPRPPLYKARGRWRVRLDALDAWAESQGLPLHPLPDES